MYYKYYPKLAIGYTFTMNVLYISYDGMTDPLGQSQVIPYLLGLSKKGHTITIISCEKKDKFKEQQYLISQLLNKANIKWLPVPYSSLPSVLSKQLNLYRIQQTASQFCKNNKPYAVHCRSYMAALIGLKLKQKFNVKFIFDMRGFWADERIDGQIWDLSNFLHKRIYNYFKKKEIDFLNNADYTISLTQNAKDEILSWKGFKGKQLPIQVIPCCADLDLFSSENIDIDEQDKLKTKLKIESSDFIISYLGSIGTWYMLDEMLDFFKCLVEKKSNAKFLFITPDKKEIILLKAAEKGIPANNLIIQAAKRNQVPLYLSLSTLSLYFIKPLFSKKASSPTKTGEIMAMGIPIITNSQIGDSDQIISDSRAGLLIQNFTCEEYYRIINEIDVLLSTDKSKIRASSKHYFSLEKGIESYNNVYQIVCNK
jgi:glycosyltransferase involved in cell wall biosynthesis